MRTFGMIPSPPDERDFPLSKAVAYAAAPIINRVVGNLPLPVDQGSTMTCMAVTLAGILEAIELKQRGVRVPISAKFIYGNRPDTAYQGEGMIPREAFQQATRYGAPRADLLPGLSDYPSSKAAVTPALDGEGLPNRIRGYVRLTSLQDISDYLALYDVPCMLGLMVYDNFMTTDGMVPAPAGNLLGGHAMRCIGIISGRAVVQNSWGPTWGRDGIGYIDLSQHRGWEAWGAIPEESDTLIKRPQEVFMTIGKPSMMVDGQQVMLDVAPFIKDGRTFLPLRALAEILGAKVEFTSFPGGGYVLLRWGGEQ